MLDKAETKSSPVDVLCHSSGIIFSERLFGKVGTMLTLKTTSHSIFLGEIPHICDGKSVVEVTWLLTD